MNDSQREITLDALDGSNPLAFLSALGALRVLTMVADRARQPPPRLRWIDDSGIWRPRLLSHLCDPDAVITALANACPCHLTVQLRADLEALKTWNKELTARRNAAWKDSDERNRIEQEIEENQSSLASLAEKLNTAAADFGARQATAEQAEKDFKKQEKALERFDEEIKKRVKAALPDERESLERTLRSERQRRDQMLHDAQRRWALALEKVTPNPAFALGDDFQVSPERFHEFAARSAASAKANDRAWADFAAAFACEVCLDRNGLVQDTTFRAVGGGQTRVLNFIRTLCWETTAGHFRSALFGAWQYNDPSPSLRLDPNEFRPYALRATNPAGEQDDKVRGANRLAIEAFPLFPVFPRSPAGRDLATTGFSNATVTWPIWGGSLPLDSIRSLLASPEIQQSAPRTARLLPLGVAQLYRSQRFTAGQYRNFAPAVPLL
jgi:hypothetical protein